MAYASATDLLARFDERTIADLASDTGEPISDFENDTKISAALDDASGKIDSALTVAQIYLPSELAELTGVSSALLKRITCELAMVFLIRRRQENLTDDALTQIGVQAEEYLDRLRKGERVFGDSEANQKAGLPTVDGPTTIDYQQLNLLPDRTRNFYPQRATRLPLGR